MLRHQLVEQLKSRFKIQWQEILYLLLPMEFLCLKITNLTILCMAFRCKMLSEITSIYYIGILKYNPLIISILHLWICKSYIHILILNDISINVHPETINCVFSSFLRCKVSLNYPKNDNFSSCFIKVLKLRESWWVWFL